MAYETPEIFELGNAEEITLGGPGCKADCCGCYKSATDEEELSVQ
jgi:hypothetical protein